MNKKEYQQDNQSATAVSVKPQRLVKCTIDIDHHSYRLASDGSIDELKAIGDLVNGKIQKLKDGQHLIEKEKLYLTAALELAEDYLRLLQAYQNLRAEMQSDAASDTQTKEKNE